jgi:hypothetical protein
MTCKRLLALLALPAMLLALQAQPACAFDTIRCESKDHKPNTCNVEARERVKVDMIQQTSKSQCLRGRTWGQSDSGVWDDRGCSGVFRVSYGSGRFNRDRHSSSHYDGPGHDRWHDDHDRDRRY